MNKVRVRIVDEQQFQINIEKTRRLVDEVCAAALGLTNGGPMGYNNFIESRTEFQNHIEEVIKHYKVVELA